MVICGSQRTVLPKEQSAGSWSRGGRGGESRSEIYKDRGG